MASELSKCLRTSGLQDCVLDNRIHHVCILGKNVLLTMQRTSTVCLFSPLKHNNLLMRQNSLIWTQQIIPCKKLRVLSQDTAPSEKRKNALLAIVFILRSRTCWRGSKSKQNCLDSEIWYSFRSTCLKSCCSEFSKSTERPFLVHLPSQVLYCLADRI